MTTFAITPPPAKTLRTLKRSFASLRFEKLEHLMVSTPADFERELFGPKAVIECLMAKEDGRAVGFALFFPQLLDLPRSSRSLP